MRRLFLFSLAVLLSMAQPGLAQSGPSFQLAQADGPVDAYGRLYRRAPAPSLQTSPGRQPVVTRPGRAPSQGVFVTTRAGFQTPEQQPSGVIRAAILLPLSGQNAAVGNAMLNAAQLAVFDLGPEHFLLMPRDTAANPDQAARAAQAAVDDGATLILGPLFGSAAAGVIPTARGRNVPVVTFSNDFSLADQGLMVMGFGPSDQAARIVSHAISQGRRRIAVLAPQNAYGDAVVDAAGETATRSGGQLVGLEQLPADTDAFGPALSALMASQPDALLIGFAGSRLSALDQALQAQGLAQSGVQILGLGTWDTPEITRYAGLQGSLFAAPDPARRANFEARYRQAYGEEPLRIATLAYDAAALAAVLAGRQNRWSGQSAYGPQLLRRDQGFDGADGLFRFGEDGVAERALAVIAVTAGGRTVREAAPQRFARN